MQCSNFGFILLLFILPFPNGWSVDHGLSHAIKGHFLFFLLRIAKEKVKETNAKVMWKTIEKKKCLPDKLVSNLEQKIKKLEEELLDMREWAKFLLSANPTLETNVHSPK